MTVKEGFDEVENYFRPIANDLKTVLVGDNDSDEEYECEECSFDADNYEFEEDSEGE
jgi:hypothetical protein